MFNILPEAVFFFLCAPQPSFQVLSVLYPQLDFRNPALVLTERVLSATTQSGKNAGLEVARRRQREPERHGYPRPRPVALASSQRRLTRTNSKRNTSMTPLAVCRAPTRGEGQWPRIHSSGNTLAYPSALRRRCIPTRRYLRTRRAGIPPLSIVQTCQMHLRSGT